MTHSDKPYGLMTSPKKSKRPREEYEAELEKEDAEMAKAKKKIENSLIKKEDKVAKKLQSYYITNASFPFLANGAGFTETVSQYYPALNIAVDKFYLWSVVVKKMIDWKIERFKNTAIKYVYLTPGDAPAEYKMDLNDLEGLF
jgi:hypothetical protein